MSEESYPGHHYCYIHYSNSSLRSFCLINFCALSALSYLSLSSSSRVGVLDIDVHFGNGSADILADVDRVRFASVHEKGIYPGSGEGEPEGSNIFKLSGEGVRGRIKSVTRF